MSKDLIFYSRHARKLQGTVGDKIEAFLTGEPDKACADQVAGLTERMGCVGYSAQTRIFYLLPLKGYNKSTYEIERDKAYGFKCSCQGWVKSKEIWEKFLKELEEVRPMLSSSQFERFKARIIALSKSIHPPNCSHIGSVYEYFARKNNEQRQARIAAALSRWF